MIGRAVRFFLAGAVVFGISMALFVLFVNHFSEGYDGFWDDPVLGAAWFALIASVVLALAGLVSLLRRTV